MLAAGLVIRGATAMWEELNYKGDRGGDEVA